MATTPVGDVLDRSVWSLLPEVLHPEFVGEAVPHTLVCPHCAGNLDLMLDPSAGKQRYVEECSLCCRPVEVRLEAHDYRVDRVEASKLF